MMQPPARQAPSNRRIAAAVAVGGMLALAAAMGIGRFAFTPVLPLMVRSGVLDMAASGWIAAANYLGYFAGALIAARLRVAAPRLVLAGLLGVVLTTAAMGVTHGSAAWLVLRFAAGAASACTFVGVAVWSLGALSRLGHPGWGGVVYAGVGSGIAASGLLCLVAARAGATPSGLWLQLAALALVLAALVALAMRASPPAPVAVAAPDAAAPVPLRPTRGLVLCYGLMGFGYILPATYLPALARELLDDPAVFGWVWPVFGSTAAASTLLASALARRFSRLPVWAAAQALMGVGVALPALWPVGASIAASAMLVGGTFMVVTMLGLQEARARAGAQPAVLLGRMTAAFALGQILAPPLATSVLAGALVATGRDPARAVPLALGVAAAALLASAAWLARTARGTPACRA